MSHLDELLQKAKAIEGKIGYVFSDKQLLVLSFVHRSFFNENRAIADGHNERLEFLGDSILGLLVAEYLYRSWPQMSEGELSKVRSRLVESTSCYAYAMELGIAEYLLLGRGEKMNDGKGRESIVSDLFEALMGAIYLDGGLEAIRNFFFSHFDDMIENILSVPGSNWKAELQDFAQKTYQQTPIYVVTSEGGPDHSKLFDISVSIADKEVGKGQGSSKKEAQQRAAADALANLGKADG